MRPLSRVLAGLSALLLPVACGEQATPEPDALPDAAELLSAGAEAMSALDTVGFDIQIDGELTSFEIQQASGRLTAEGDVEATAQLLQGGRLVEAEYVRVDGTSYLKLATGGFRELSPAAAARIFDPSTLLAPDGGIPAALAAATNGRTLGEQSIGGVDTYHVKAEIEPQLIEGLALLVTGPVEPADLWISQTGDRLIRATLTFGDPGTDEDTVVTVTFSDFDEDVDIQAPI